MTVGLGQKYSEVAIRKIEIDVLIRDLRNRIVPPGHTFLAVEHIRDALVKRVFEERSLGVGSSTVRGPTGECNDCEQK